MWGRDSVMRGTPLVGGRPDGLWLGPGASRPGGRDPGTGGGGRARLGSPEKGDTLGRPGGSADSEAEESSRSVSSSTLVSCGQSSPLQHTKMVIIANEFDKGHITIFH